jgi:hypothetical protein
MTYYRDIVMVPLALIGIIIGFCICLLVYSIVVGWEFGTDLWEETMLRWYEESKGTS